MILVSGRLELDLADKKIRSELLRTPGSAVCPLKPCMVVTQGGITGERAHQHGIIARRARP